MLCLDIQALVKQQQALKNAMFLKRFERIDVLKKLGRWDENEKKRITGLPKTPALAG